MKSREREREREGGREGEREKREREREIERESSRNRMGKDRTFTLLLYKCTSNFTKVTMSKCVCALWTSSIAGPFAGDI